MANQARTIVEYFAEHEAYRCGYCGNSDTNFSHGMWAHAMTVQDYQDLLDRGWRRSGKYSYKPTMNVTCCPMYTIRCEALNFKLRKSHKKALKKINKYLIDGVKPKCDNDEECDEDESKTSKSEKQTVAESDQKLGTSQSDSDEKPGTSKSSSVQRPGTSQSECAPSSQSAGNQSSTSGSRASRPGEGVDPDKPPCKKAKDRRKEKKLAKLAAKGQTVQPDNTTQKTKPASNKGSEGKTLEEWLSEPERAEHCAHKLEVRLVRSCPQSQLFKDTLKETHEVYHKYQTVIHRDAPDKPSMKQFTRFLIDSPLEVRLVRSHPQTDEFGSSFDDSYNIYEKYQMSIHKEEKKDCGIGTYTDFLVASPLEETHPGGTLSLGYGSFHHQYILDGKLICVGVIDILPSLVSSKYLYYDPEYQFLSLGTYSALREIALVRELHKQSEEMLYYYMGYYIQSCPKMVYKGQYYPSYLLCPETYTWHPVEKCAPMLDANKYCRFEEDPSVVDKNGEVDLENLLVLHKRQLMNYPIYKMLSKGENDDEEEVKEYAGFIGKKCSTSIVLYRK